MAMIRAGSAPGEAMPRSTTPDVFAPDEVRVLDGFSRPEHVQAFLDTLRYSEDPIYRSPRSVLRDGKAHCFDGALFAAAALERLGFPPRLVDLRAVRDDDHVLAVFQVDGHWGAVAKSNFVGLRWREPVHRTLRELAVSYLDAYFNLDYERSLREFSRPVDLHRFDALAWRTADDGLEAVATALDAVRHTPVLTPAQIQRLARVDERTYQAQLLGSNAAGLYRPGGHKG